MLIVTPAAGSWPEPRPQQLITGDRAIMVLDTVSSTALQAAGVKKATVSADTYNELVAELIPEVFDGLDPTTGKLKDDYLPDRLSTASIAALDVTGTDGKIETTFLPDYLTPTGITALLGASSTAVIDTDPDGTPVVVGGSPSTTSATYTGTVTASTLTAGTTHGDLITGTLSEITAMQSNEQTLVEQSVTPGTPASTGIKLYADLNGRAVYLDSAAIQRRASTIRIVTTLPTSGESYLGDECIISATGEHRIYKGTTLGWRLASGLSVSTLTDRNAITNQYPGMKVWCNFGTPQDHVWQSDNQWHGTKPFFINATPFSGASTTINDTNWHEIDTQDVVDPGYPWTLSTAGLCVVTNNKPTNNFTQFLITDYHASTNPIVYYEFGVTTYGQPGIWNWLPVAGGYTTAITGSKTLYSQWNTTFVSTGSFLRSEGLYQRLIYTINPA